MNPQDPEDVIDSARLMASRMARMDPKKVDLLVKLLLDLKEARSKEYVNALREIPQTIVEVLAPEVLGDIYYLTSEDEDDEEDDE